MDIESLRAVVEALGESSAKSAATAWANGNPVNAAYFEGEVQRTLEVLALIDSTLDR
jgi:hypothetical protein